MSMFLLDFPQDRPYTGKAGAEDREIQGWNPSADSSAGMTGLPDMTAPFMPALESALGFHPWISLSSAPAFPV